MLYVDDDSTLRLCIGRELRSHFGDVDTADSVADALPKIPDANFVVTDWNLGDGLGQQVVDECQKHGVPVVVFSGSFDLKTDAPVIWKADPDALVDKVRDMIR